MPLFVAGVASYWTASRGLAEVSDQSHADLQAKVFDELIAVRELKKQEIEEYVGGCKKNLNLLAEALHHSEQTTEDRDEFLADYCEIYGYYDVFLIQPDGQVSFSVARESDYQTNMVNGKYSTSNLGQLVRQVLASRNFGFADFMPYAPSNGEPAAFIAQPLQGKNGDIEMIVACQFPLEGIDRIMSTRSGMGETGETYLVGSDMRMRSNSFLDKEGRSVAASFAGTIEKNGVRTEASQEALAGSHGEKIIIDYNGHSVLSAFTPIDVFGVRWALLAEIDEVEAFETAEAIRETSASVSSRLLAEMLVIGLAVVLAIIGVGFTLASRVVAPIRRSVEFAQHVAEGDLTQRIEEDRDDELGDLGKALNDMSERLQTIMRGLTTDATTLTGSSSRLTDVATQLASGAEETTCQSTVVASAAEEMTNTMAGMVSAAEEMTTNVKTVAVATEQMTTSISEIAKNAEESSRVASNATELARVSNDTIAHLGTSAHEIGNVIQVIQDLAEQTNLLALNATIEAARAGSAGKGFAVVATEVKELAKQSADAAEDIRNRIEGIQNSSGEAIDSIKRISDVIDLVSEASRTIASAVEEQSVTTREIASNISQASVVMETVREGVSQSASTSREITQNIVGVDVAAKQTAEGASHTQVAGSELSHLAGQFKDIVTQFKV